MAKQIKRLKDSFTRELVALDSVIINMVDLNNGKKVVKMPLASISGANLMAQLDFGPKVIIDTTTAEGKNVYYKLRPTSDSGIALPVEEGYYSLEDADLWLDTQEENKDKHIIRVRQGRFVKTGSFKKKDELPF